MIAMGGAQRSVESDAGARDGSAVRPEYQALVDHFPALLHDLGATIGSQALDDLGVLMAAIEHVDRALDATVDARDRERLTRATIALLGESQPERDRLRARDAGTSRLGAFDPLATQDIELAARVHGSRVEVEHPNRLQAVTGRPGTCAELAELDAELASRLESLRAVAIRLGVCERLAALTASTLANTEGMRAARHRAAYLTCIEREGDLCVELALMIGAVDHPGAVAFLRAVAPPANLLDKLLDLRGDHRRGEVAVSPGVRTHVWLAARLLRRAWSAARLHPSPARFGLWGTRWLYRMTQ